MHRERTLSGLWRVAVGFMTGERSPSRSRIALKGSLATLAALALVAVQAQADVIFGGDFQLYVTGTSYTVTAELSGPGAFDSYAQGVGDAIPLAGGTAEAYGADGSTNKFVDLPGWKSVHGGNPDSGKNGVGGTTGLNIFASWGGQQRVETTSPVGTVEAGTTYTISAMVDGPAGGPIEGDVAFHLLANGTPLTADAPLPALTGGLGFQEISRTYDAAALAGHEGEALTIVIGVEDSNTLGNRMIWDDVSLSAQSDVLVYSSEDFEAGTPNYTLTNTGPYYLTQLEDASSNKITSIVALTGTDYDPTSPSRSGVWANNDLPGTIVNEPTGQHGFVCNSQNRSLLSNYPMTLESDGATSLTISFDTMLYGYEHSNTNFPSDFTHVARVLYSPSGGNFSAADSVLIATFATANMDPAILAGLPPSILGHTTVTEDVWTNLTFTLSSSDVTFADTATISLNKTAPNVESQIIFYDNIMVTADTATTSPYDSPYGLQWNFMIGASGADAGGGGIAVTGDGTVFVQNRTSNNDTWGSGITGSINSGVGAITPLGKVIYGTTLRSIPGLISPGQNYPGGIHAAGDRAYLSVYDSGQYWVGEDGNDATRAHVYSLDSSGLSSVSNRHTLSVYANNSGTLLRTDALKPITTGLTPYTGQNRIAGSALRDSTLDMVLVMDMVNGDFATANDYEGYNLRSSGTAPAYLPGIGVYNFAANTLSGPAKQPILTCSNTNGTWSNMGTYLVAGIDQVSGYYYGGGISHSRNESVSDGWDPDGSGSAGPVAFVNSSSRANTAAIGTAYDASHNLLYSVTWDTAGYDIIYDIEASSDGSNAAFWAGEKLDDCYIEKRDASGTIVWSNSFDMSSGTGVERIRDVSVDDKGDLLVTGYFENGGAGGGSAAYDTFVRKYKKTAPNDYAVQWEITNGLANVQDFIYGSALDPTDRTLYTYSRTDAPWPNTTGHTYAGNGDLIVQKFTAGDFDDGTGTGTPDGLVNFDDVDYAGSQSVTGLAGVDTYDFNEDGDSTLQDVHFMITNIMDRAIGDIYPGEISEMHSDVDNADLGKAIGSYTGSGGGGKGYLNGDMDFDGDVDDDDIDYMVNAYSGAMTPNGTWPLVGKPMTNGTSANLYYNPVDGNVWLTASGAPGSKITSFQLENLAGSFVPANYVGPAAGSYGDALENVTASVLADTDRDFSGFGGIHNLGQVFPTGMSLETLQGYLSTAVYTGAAGTGQEVFNVVVTDVPPRPISLLIVR